MANQVKISRLDEIEVARAAFLPPDEKKKVLRSGKSGRPPYHLNAVRNHFVDILGIPASVLMPVTRASWRKLRAIIRKDCRNFKDEQIANVQLGKGLYDFREAHISSATPHEFLSLSVGLSGESLTYWQSAVLEIDGRLYVACIDPRRARGLTRKCLPFVFSMMHAAIREGRDELKAVRFVVIQFGDVVRGARKVKLRFEPDGFEPVNYEALKLDIQETYRIWEEVLQERAAERRRAAA